MIRRWNWRILLLSAATAGFVGCGEATDEPADDTTAAASVTQDGIEKPRDLKGDAWNYLNDPARFRAELEYNFEKLPMEGQAKKIAWAATYWPTYRDSINHRWQGDDVLSPAEKYDVAFNDWKPAEGFMELKPFDNSSCEWDEAYYTSLGPAASYVSDHKGNKRARNGVDDDGDGKPDAEECGYGEDVDNDGVETWWGLCHAWVPAAVLEDEPQRAVTRNGVTFEVSDLKALLIMQYDRADALMLGGRCNEKDVERDDDGRIDDALEQCQDVNAGAFHVIVTNFLGKMGRSIAEDRTFDYQVWNQPVQGYKITEQRELTLDEVNELLRPSAFRPENNLPTTDEEKAAVLLLADTLTRDAFLEVVGLSEREADAILALRNGEDGEAGTDDDQAIDDYDALAEEIGDRAIVKLLEQARVEGRVPAVEPAIYSFNPDAERFVEVRMRLEYITESHASREPNSDHIERYTRNDNYHYVLELDGAGNIIGGEWAGYSNTSHPDFLWLPLRARSGNPHIDIDLVRDLIAESRADEPASEALRFASDARLEIPDADPEGVQSSIAITEAGLIKEMTIDVEIEHSYRGDLVVQLVREGDTPVTVTVYDGGEAESSWEDDVRLTAEMVEGFSGTELAGTWSLKVVDSAASDTGTLLSWGLNVVVE